MFFPISGRAVAAALLVAAAPLAAHDYRAGDIAIGHPVLRVASPVSKTGAGYLTLVNRGRTPDRLVAVSTASAARADIHGTTSSNGVMQMRAQADGVTVPPGGTVTFAPGGLHVMFIGLKQSLPPGTMVDARLRFEKAGEVAVKFQAESAADPSHQHGKD